MVFFLSQYHKSVGGKILKTNSRIFGRGTGQQKFRALVISFPFPKIWIIFKEFYIIYFFAKKIATF